MLLTDAALLVRDHYGTGRPSGIQQLETMATELILQECNDLGQDSERTSRSKPQIGPRAARVGGLLVNLVRCDNRTNAVCSCKMAVFECPDG